jgi:peptidoglycan/xylan/chitin deacetylase (PgdA/CDA1 family)
MLSNPSHPLPFTERHVPWAKRKGAALWPGGARLAALVYVAIEEWAWDRAEPLTPAGTLQLPTEKVPSLATRSAVDYGWEVGLWRLREIFAERNLQVTLWTNGNAADWHPDVLRELADAGHEVAAHGYSEGIPPTLMSVEEQLQDIRASARSLEHATGRRPRGWISPGAMSTAELPGLLAQEEFAYHADLQNDELPYFIDVAGRSIVEIPYRMVGNINDFYMFGTRIGRYSTRDALDYLKSTFDAYYRAAAIRPLHFCLGTHFFVSGRPEPAEVLEEFLDYVLRHDDVWLPTYTQVADWWNQQFPSKHTDA